MTQPFIPVAGKTTTLSATTSSASASVDPANYQLRFYNAGAVPVFIRFGKGTQTAVATTDMPLAPGAVEVYTKVDADNVGYITASSTATVYMTQGNGE